MNIRKIRKQQMLASVSLRALAAGLPALTKEQIDHILRKWGRR